MRPECSAAGTPRRRWREQRTAAGELGRPGLGRWPWGEPRMLPVPAYGACHTSRLFGPCAGTRQHRLAVESARSEKQNWPAPLPRQTGVILTYPRGVSPASPASSASPAGASGALEGWIGEKRALAATRGSSAHGSWHRESAPALRSRHEGDTRGLMRGPCVPPKVGSPA